jgi:mannose-6-phosphate isomerase-like protein (cupin superfamily)
MSEVIEKVNLNAKFGLFSDHWNPRIIGELNDCFVKIAKFKDEFTWHHHELEDELFLVVRGSMRMKLRDPLEREVMVNEGEILIVPKGVEHLPGAATEEAWILMLEPKTTLNTGTVVNEKTVVNLERL